eukprot:g1910.t1
MAQVHEQSVVLEVDGSGAAGSDAAGSSLGLHHRKNNDAGGQKVPEKNQNAHRRRSTQEIDPKILKQLKKSPKTLKELVRGVPQDLQQSFSETFTAVLSGIICGILAVTFNVVKALLTFDAVLQIAPIGVGCYHVTTIVAGIGAAFYSSCPIAMGGPNIKHALLLSPMVIQPMICKIDPSLEACTSTHLGSGNSGSSGGHRRMLLGAASAGNGTSTDTLSAETYDTILATSLFAMLYTTFIFSVMWYLMGKYKLTRVLQFLPSFVTSGFIASCGYLIVTKAILVSTSMHFSVQVNHFDVKHALEGKFWYLLLPALALGVSMFYAKYFKIGKVMYVVPSVLLGSTLLFFTIVFASGNTLETARGSGWFYQEFPQTLFYKQWEGLNFFKIRYALVFEQTYQILIIWIILTLDALLQLVAIKRQFEVDDMDFDDEIVLASKYNLLNTACVAAPGYSLLKFTWENYGFIHNTHDKLPGVVYVMFVGITFFTGIPIVNILPRFFLGALIIFTGSGFLVTSLVQTYKQVPMLEYCGIWIMMGITAITELTYSVLIGLVMALVIFVYKYGKKGAVKAIFTGAEYQSCVVRNHRDQLRLQHLGKLSMIVQLHRYLFFGLVVGVREMVESILEERSRKHALDGKIKYLLIDFEHCDGIDHTCGEVLTEIAKACRREDIEVIFTHLGTKHRLRLQQKDPKLFHKYGKHFSTQDEGAEYVEEELLRWAADVRKRWLIFDSLKRLHGRHILQAKHEAFEEVLGDHSSDDIWKYIEKEEIKKGTELCIAGEVNDKLYVLQRGRLTSYLQAGDSHNLMTGARVRLHTMTRGAYVNEDSLYLDMPVSHKIVAERDSTVISITRDKLKQMEAENPEIAIQIMRTVLMHTATIRNTLEMEINAVDHWEEVKIGRMQAKLISENSGGMGLTQMMSNFEAMDLHGKSVGYDENQHYFHHLKLPDAEPMSPRMGAQGLGDSEKVTDQPTLHLSSNMLDTVRECFRRHVASSTANAQYQARRVGLFSKLRAKQAKTVVNSAHNIKIEARRNNMRLKNMTSDQFLAEMSLGQYAHDLKQKGYDYLNDLLLADEGEIKAIVKTLKQGSNDTVMDAVVPHRRRFLNKIEEIRRVTNDLDKQEETPHASENSNSGGGAKNPASTQKDIESFAPNVLTLYETLEALMDLGVFPTKKEIFAFINYLQKKENDKIDARSPRNAKNFTVAAHAAVVSASRQASEIALSSELVDPEFVEAAGMIVREAQFLQLVEMLELKELTTSQINYFRNIFYEFADDDGALTSGSLGYLMTSIGHPESPLELKQLVRRWDIDGKGHIDFDNFVSMISCFLKKEEVEQEVENDFAKFALASGPTPATKRKGLQVQISSPNKRSMEVNEDSVITVDNIRDLFREMNIAITLDEAEEMIFEGDYNEDKSLSFHEFVDLITLVHDSELN